MGGELVPRIVVLHPYASCAHMPPPSMWVAQLWHRMMLKFVP